MKAPSLKRNSHSICRCRARQYFSSTNYSGVLSFVVQIVHGDVAERRCQLSSV